MVIFELGREIEKHVFRLGTSVEQKKFNCIEPQTFRIPRSDALPLSYRYSMMSEAHYEVHLRIINFQLNSFCN